MQKKLLIAALCLLATVILCGAQSTEGPTINGSTTTPETGATANQTAAPSTAITGNQSTIPATDPNTLTTVNATLDDSSGGLSSGAIAGIVIGTIGGVALLGGGIYGVLKCTNTI